MPEHAGAFTEGCLKRDLFPKRTGELLHASSDSSLIKGSCSKSYYSVHEIAVRTAAIQRKTNGLQRVICCGRR
jgi:hypothetical protein